MNNEQEVFEYLRQVGNHPILRELSSSLTVKLPADLEEVFAMVGQTRKDVNSPFHEVQDRKTFSDEDYFYNLLMMGVQEGLRSSFYFLQHFLVLAEFIRGKALTMTPAFKSTRSVVVAINAPAVIADYEGFTFLSRATLDRLNYFFKYYFQIENKRLSNLYQLKNELKQKYAASKGAQSLIESMNRHSSYLDTQFVGGEDQPTERNRLAHREYISFTTPNIMFTPEGTVRVVLVHRPDVQTDAEEELTNRFDKLKLFIIDVLKSFFDLQGKS